MSRLLALLGLPLAALTGCQVVAEAEAERARGGRRTILFVDEIHRFNKSQQDAFLPHVESGLFTFIGATTENPSFEVNAALLSRAKVIVLRALTSTETPRLQLPSASGGATACISRSTARVVSTASLIAVAAIGSVGETTAPSTNAGAQDKWIA
mgnify:CR=1 FL=1